MPLDQSEKKYKMADFSAQKRMNSGLALFFLDVAID